MKKNEEDIKLEPKRKKKKKEKRKKKVWNNGLNYNNTANPAPLYKTLFGQIATVNNEKKKEESKKAIEDYSEEEWNSNSEK